MAHLLLVQEFGSNLGHINRLLAVARAVPAYRFTVVVPHPELAIPRVRAALGPDSVVLQAPRFSAPAISWPPARPEQTLADVFHALGYHHEAPLEQAARRWLDLLEDVSPDLILSDFAATFRIANRRSVPVIAVADAFGLVPPGGTCPPIMPDTPDDPVSALHEEALLDSARRVAVRLGSDPVATFGELFSGDAAFPIAIRLLDPYGHLRAGPARPSISLPRIRSGPAFASRNGPSVFCYLWAAHPALNPVVSALNRLPVRSLLHVRGVDPAEVAKHCAPQVGVCTAEADFTAVLPQSRLFIHYGGGGSSQAGLLAGTVQLVLPTALEQEAAAARLARAGVALWARPGPDADPESVSRTILGLLGDTGRQEAALRHAAELAAMPQPDTLGEIRSACERLIGGEREAGPRFSNGRRR